MRSFALLVVCVLVVASPLFAEEGRKSTAEEREVFVKGVKLLEKDPVGRQAAFFRAWALKWITEIEDIVVVVDGDVLEPVMKRIPEEHPVQARLVGQFLFAAAVYTIKHPKDFDADERNVYALRSCLTMYGNFVKLAPDMKLPILDELLKLDAAGKLADLVKKDMDPLPPAGEPPDKVPDEPPEPEEKPGKLTLAADGFPTGQTTPEGAVCDMIRAFIDSDPERYDGVVVPSYGDAKVREGLKDFTARMRKLMAEEKARPADERTGLKSISVCHAADRVDSAAPDAFVYASLGWRDVMFVDAVAVRHGEETVRFRTLVLEDPDGKWFVHPYPPVTPMLMEDLKTAEKTEVTFQERYELDKLDDAVPEP